MGDADSTHFVMACIKSRMVFLLTLAWTAQASHSQRQQWGAVVNQPAGLAGQLHPSTLQQHVSAPAHG